MKKLKLLVLLGVIACLVIGAVSAFSRFTSAESKTIATLRVQTEIFDRRVPAEGYLKAEKATPITAPVGVPPLKIAWIKENGSSVKAGEVVVRFDRDDFERKLEDGNSDRKVAEAKLAGERAKSKGAEDDRDRSATLARKNLEVAQIRADEQDDEIFSANEILSSRIDGKLSEARVAHAEGAMRLDRSIARSKLELLELEKKAAELSIQRAEQGLTKMEVTAPHEGIFVYDWSTLKAGDQMHPGQSFAKLPLVETMEAEVFVLEADAMGLEKGKKASLVLESHRERTYQATIKSVDSLAKPRQRDVPIQYFSVTLELESTDAEVMKPGQRVEATLELESTEAVVVPRQCVFDVDGEMVAYRRQGKGYEAVKLKLGPGSPGRVVVLEGLADGDIIATQDPFGAASGADEETEETGEARPKP